MNEEREVHGMTDKQFLNHLNEILAIAEKSKDLDEFVKELKQRIDEYIGK